MKNLKFLSTLFLFACLTASMRGQAKLESGDIAGLKGVTKVNLIYDYSHMGVGSFATEQEYIDKKMDDNKKDPAKADKWKEGWLGARKGRYEPKFEELFTKTGEKTGIYGINYASDAPVTLKVETTFIEPGFNVGVVRKNASVNFKCTFMTKEGKEIATYLIRNVPGGQAMGYDFDAGSRIAESYAKAAKMLMKDVNKRVKKLK